MAIGLPKAILSSPIRFDIPAVRRFIEDVLDTMAQETVRDFQTSTRTWQEHHPAFLIEKRPYFRRVYTSDSIYAYLNYGTSVRHAAMSSDFTPKTTPGVLSAEAGSGGVVRVSRLINRTGIKARRFDLLVQKRAQQKMVQRVSRGLFDAVKKRI